MRRTSLAGLLIHEDILIGDGFRTEGQNLKAAARQRRPKSYQKVKLFCLSQQIKL